MGGRLPKLVDGVLRVDYPQSLMTMKYEVVLFDADGTLFDFGRAESYALELAFEDSGLTFHARYFTDYSIVNLEAWQQFERGEITSGELRLLRFERFCARAGVDVEPERLSKKYLSRLAEAAFLLDGAAEVVRTLSKSCRLAIVTNGLTDVQHGRFGRSPICSHFEEIVISEEVGTQKPDPAIFAYTLNRMGHEDKSTVLMVGDSLSSDIQGGVNFGIDTCWFNPSGGAPPAAPTPSYVVDDLAKILPLCRSSAVDAEGQG